MRWFYFRNPRGRFSPSPKLRKIKYGFALILVVFLYFPTFSEPHNEIPKKRRAWDSNPRATSAVLSRAFTSGATTRPQPRLRVKGVHIAVMCGRTRPSRHAEGKCIKNFIKIDYFSSKSQAISIKFLIRKNQHAEGKSNKNHAKIDGFSSKFQSKFVHKKSTRRR